jgi:hypothetical protein
MPNGVSGIPLTSLAVQAFLDQLRIAGPGLYWFPNDRNPSGQIRDMPLVSVPAASPMTG